MVISEALKEVYQGQQYLSAVNIDFLKFVEQNPDTARRANFKLLELNDRLFTLQPWPTFINGETRVAFREAGVKLFDLIKRIPERFFNNDPEKMSAYYEIPIEEIKNQLAGITGDHIDSLVGRGDFMFTASGLKCLEYNVAASLGGWQIPVWEFLYLNNPLIARFLREYNVKTKNENLLYLFLEHVIKSTLKKIPGCEEEINIAFVATDTDVDLGKSIETYLNKLLKDILARKEEAIKGRVFVCDFFHLESIDGCLFYKEKRIHVVTEMNLGNVSSGVIEAFKNRSIRLINGPITQLLSHKLNLALLSDDETNGVFTAEEKETIDTYVPWTRKISPGSTSYAREKINDLEHFILCNKEKLVIKPSVGYGGDGVCVGIKCSESQWQEAVKNAIKGKNWVVQELVKPAAGLYQAGENGCDIHDIVWGFFVFGNRYTGAWARVMPQKDNRGVINCHQGASVSIVFEVEDQRKEKKKTKMEITGEMEDTLEKLSKVNLDFLEFVKQNPGSLKRSNFSTLDLDSHFYRLQSWPTFISKETKKSFQDIGGKVCDLIKKIPERLFDNDPEKIGTYFGLPANVVELQLKGVTQDHLAPLVGRADFTFSTSGLKCLEFNVTANVSGWQIPEWEALYLKTPIIAKFMKEYQVKINNENFMGLFLDHVIHSSLHLVNSRHDNAELNLAVVQRGYPGMDKDKSPMLGNLNRLYKEQLSRKSLRGRVIMCDYPHLEFPDHEVRFEGKRIHALTELYHGLVPPGVMEAFTAGNLRLLNGPITGLLSNKLNLALLSEYEDSDKFSEGERAVIEKYVPWTRKIVPGEAVYKGEKITMENFLISHKDRLVIKPAVGLGGEGVYIGQATPAKQWEDVVNTALRKKNHLVQELVETPPGLYQLGEEGCVYHDTVWGVWFLGSQYGASFVRALPGGNTKRVINAFQGASISVVFEVDN